jgi:predicted Holliday junction resolvase-like endonuclease
VAVGIGKIIEKILPAHKNFTIPPPDCRFLGEPIDMVVFDSISNNDINHITFLDVKTGNAKLNPHQKLVRDAVNAHNVEWKVV